jgi:hypothetical protein
MAVFPFQKCKPFDHFGPFFLHFYQILSMYFTSFLVGNRQLSGLFQQTLPTGAAFQNTLRQKH